MYEIGRTITDIGKSPVRGYSTSIVKNWTRFGNKRFIKFADEIRNRVLFLPGGRLDSKTPIPRYKKYE